MSASRVSSTTRLTDPSLTVILPILQSTHYLVLLAVNIVVSMGVNSLIDYFMARNSGPWYTTSGTVMFNIMLTCFIVCLLTFFSFGDTQKRIRAGKAMPVTRDALCDNFVKRVLCFSMQEPNWKRRLPLALWNALLVPALPVIIFITVVCICTVGADGLDPAGDGGSCPLTLESYLLVTEAWKVVMTVWIFTQNYLAGHNEEQPDVTAYLSELAGGAMKH